MAELTYKNACIMYLEQNMECVSYRDYIIEQLNKLEQIENIVDAYITDNYADGLKKGLEITDKYKAESEDEE